MIEIREAKLADVDAIRQVFQAEYEDYYAYPQYYDTEMLAKLVYADDSILLVAIDTVTGRVAGTASVVFSIGVYNDLLGEFGRLVVHPDFRGQGIGKLLMQARLTRVQSRLHVGLVENRASHVFSQKISNRFGFVPIGFLPMKLLLQRRESVALYVQYFGDALTLRRNNPRIIPEAATIAGLALNNCKLPNDAIIDDSSAAYPHGDSFEIEALKTEGYAALLRIERGRVIQRDIFGPVRLHYGMFQLEATHSHYLIARRQNTIAGGIGFMIDEAEKAVRVFELISSGDEPIRFLLADLVRRCENELDVEYVELDVSAYAPRMQRTLLELGFLPVSYVPANVFHEVERLDAVKFVKLLVPFDLGLVEFCDVGRPIAEAVINSFTQRSVMPRIAAVSQHVPLFETLNEEQRNRLLGICHTETFAAKQAIFRQGDHDNTMHLILDGVVDLTTAEGRTIASLSGGQCLGETVLLTANHDSVHSMTATAKTSVDTATFTRQQFADLLRQRPDIGVIIYRNLAIDVSKKLHDVHC